MRPVEEDLVGAILRLRVEGPAVHIKGVSSSIIN